MFLRALFLVAAMQFTLPANAQLISGKCATSDDVAKVKDWVSILDTNVSNLTIQSSSIDRDISSLREFIDSEMSNMKVQLARHGDIEKLDASISKVYNNMSETNNVKGFYSEDHENYQNIIDTMNLVWGLIALQGVSLMAIVFMLFRRH